MPRNTKIYCFLCKFLFCFTKFPFCFVQHDCLVIFHDFQNMKTNISPKICPFQRYNQETGGRKFDAWRFLLGNSIFFKKGRYR